MTPAEQVEVESCKCHDGVVCVFLIRQEDFASRIPLELEVLVECRDDAFDVGGRSGEKRCVLDIRIVLGHVRDKVVDVVGRLPPPNRESAAEVGDESSDESVDYEVAGYTAVTGVVCGEHNLLLDTSVRPCRNRKLTYPE